MRSVHPPRSLGLILALLAALALCTACSAASSPVSFMVFGDPAELAAYQALVDAFHQKHPEIQVELIHIPSQSDYRARLATDFAAGNPADVVLLNYRRYASFAAKNALEPLGPYLQKSDLIRQEDFYPQAVEPFIWQGELACIPQNISSLVVYYNKDLFTAAGVAFPSDDWNWDDFLSTAQALTRDTDGDGVTDQYGLGVEASIFRLAPFIWQNNGELVNDPLNPTRLMLDTPEALKAFQFFVDLQVKHRVAPDAVAEAAEDSESRFLNGRLGMYLNSRRGTPTYRESAAFDWDVAPLPQLAEKASILHADAYCMPAVSKHKDAAWIFIEYANSVEGQTIVAASGRTVPSLISVAQSPAFLDPAQKPANSRIFLDTIPTLRAAPVMATWVDIEEISSEEIARAFYGQTDIFDAALAAIRRCQLYFGETE